MSRHPPLQGFRYTRMAWGKLAVLLFFTLILLAPFTGWLMSLPLWAMDVAGHWVSSPLHSRSERWFNLALLMAAVPSLIAVLMRSIERNDRELRIGVVVAAFAVAAILVAPARNAQRFSADAIVGSVPAVPAEPSAMADALASQAPAAVSPPPQRSAREREAEIDALIRGAASSAVHGDSFYRQQLAMIAVQARGSNAKRDADRYEGAMRLYREASAVLQPGAGAERIEPIEHYLSAAAAADPSRALPPRELGTWRLGAFTHGLGRYGAAAARPLDIVDAESLRRQRDAARANFLQALRIHPTFDGAWRGLAWTWLYDQPDLALGALIIEAEQAGRAGGSRAVRQRIDAAGGAEAAPRFQILQARAQEAAMELHGLSIPAAVRVMARRPLPSLPPAVAAMQKMVGTGVAVEPAPDDLSTIPRLSDALDAVAFRGAKSAPSTTALLAGPWRRGALVVAGPLDLSRWRARVGAGGQKSFDARIAGWPRYRIARGFDLPRGLDRSAPAILILPAMIERPRGDLGNVVLLDASSGACSGRYCGWVLRGP
ncbi:hypothetical protein [Lysobacter antibioticus]|uniref:Transmembrane protein n=1 Tax=Lysobacter antibioticus TaxID=84531 RepID=A0A0S2FE74_LYSAN|nr:hypothetical protein [Lysobacter antibioticus]ALN81757.1 hypothetical protein LA76x_3635 [Lysobacter antibioticus]